MVFYFLLYCGYLSVIVHLLWGIIWLLCRSQYRSMWHLKTQLQLEGSKSVLCWLVWFVLALSPRTVIHQSTFYLRLTYVVITSLNNFSEKSTFRVIYENLIGPGVVCSFVKTTQLSLPSFLHLSVVIIARVWLFDGYFI